MIPFKVEFPFYIGRGRVIAQTELEEDGLYPVYSSQTKDNGCLGFINSYDFDRSQLTWTTDGANAGTVFLREGKHNCTNVCGTLLPKSEINSLHYMKYSLEYIAIYHKRADTNGYKIMNNEMAEIKLTLPPLIQQQAIANFLDQKVSEIDHILKKTRESIEEYKKYKQSLITEAVTKGLNPDVEMKDSGIEWIGEIPRHWEVKPCKYVANLNTGKTPPTTISRYFNGDITWYKPGDFNADFRLNDSQDKLTTEAINDRAVELNPENTVYFVGVGATVGKIGYSKNKAFCNQQVTALVAKQINSEFLLYLMQSANVYIQNNALYTTLPIINNGYLGSIKFSIPPLIEQIDIVKYINCKLDEINSLISQKETLLSDLETYKKSLIYECVTGKREVD